MIDVNSFLTRNHLLILIILIIIGLFVRIIGISDLPLGLNQDEASTGYDAYSILHFGHDRMGHSYPVQLESWGNGQYALSAYFSIPFISLLGLNIFSIRIVNSLFGILSMIIFYLIFKKVSTKNTALFALFIFVINPWNIMASRWGLDCNLFPPMVLLGVYFLIKAINNAPWYLLLSSIFFAISLYSYGTSYLFIPIFLVVVLVYIIVNKQIDLKVILSSALVFLLIALPIFLCIIINHFDLYSINILGITIPKMTANRTTEVFNIITHDFIFVFAKNIVRFLSVILLQSDGSNYNSIPIFGTIYHISIPFFIAGVYSVFKDKVYLKNKIHFVFLAWLVSAIILGVSIHSNINRINIIFIPILYFIVLGVSQIKEWFRPEYALKVQKSIIILYGSFFLFFVGYYFVYNKDKNKSDFPYGLGEAIRYAKSINQQGTIHITNSTINMPYIYACFYEKVNPDLFLSTAEFIDSDSTGFRSVTKFAGFSFGSMKLESDSVFIISSVEKLYGHYPDFVQKDFGNYCVLTKN